MNALEYVNDSEQWKHLIKKHCIVCDSRLENTTDRYKSQGNFCPQCCSEAQRGTSTGTDRGTDTIN